MTMLTAPAAVQGQDRVSLAEVIPILAGSEIGQLELGPAPAPGTSRMVHAREIRAALRRAGRSVEGLIIPRRTVVQRDARVIHPDELEQLSRDAVDRALGGCQANEITASSDVQIGTGELQIEARGTPPRRSGKSSMVLRLHSNGRVVNTPVRVQYTCPEAVLEPGDFLTLKVRVGRVYATAPGRARQAGRVGDRIRVVNRITGARLLGVVVDSATVEVQR